MHFFQLALKRGKWIWYRPKHRDINARYLAASGWKEGANRTVFSFSITTRLFRISGWCLLFSLNRNKIKMKINNSTRTKLRTAHFLFQKNITFQVHRNLGKESLDVSQCYETNHDAFLPRFLIALIGNTGTVNRQVKNSSPPIQQLLSLASFNDGSVICLTRITLHNRAGPH